MLVNVEHPGFKSLLADPALPSELTGPGRELQGRIGDPGPERGLG